jgi:hypothetical protein
MAQNLKKKELFLNLKKIDSKLKYKVLFLFFNTFLVAKKVPKNRLNAKKNKTGVGSLVFLH